MIRNLHLRYVFLCLLFPILAFSSGAPPNINITDIIGKWTVQSIHFSDCPQNDKDSSLDMYKSNCFTSIDHTEICIVMDMEFQKDGSLTQTFKTYENGKLIENKVEKSHYTVGDSRITICNPSGTSCETSLIDIENGKLIIKGRDVANKCYVLLESTK